MISKNSIFVFGSNLSGIHGAGAAKVAHAKYGAKYGKGKGLQGHSYALATKGFNIEPISLQLVAKHIQEFMAFAYDNKGTDFKVTQVGCDIGGFTKLQIAPMFTYSAYTGSNLYFDTAWIDLLPDTAKFWGTYE